MTDEQRGRIEAAEGILLRTRQKVTVLANQFRGVQPQHARQLDDIDCALSQAEGELQAARACLTCGGSAEDCPECGS